MRSRTARRHVLVAALLVLPLLALATGPSQHEGHGCHFDKDCLTCRWAADSVADATHAPEIVNRPDPGILAPEAPPATARGGAPRAVSARGPPLS